MANMDTIDNPDQIGDRVRIRATRQMGSIASFAATGNGWCIALAGSNGYVDVPFDGITNLSKVARKRHRDHPDKRNGGRPKRSTKRPTTMRLDEQVWDDLGRIAQTLGTSREQIVNDVLRSYRDAHSGVLEPPQEHPHR